MSDTDDPSTIVPHDTGNTGDQVTGEVLDARGVSLQNRASGPVLDPRSFKSLSTGDLAAQMFSQLQDDHLKLNADYRDLAFTTSKEISDLNERLAEERTRVALRVQELAFKGQEFKGRSAVLLIGTVLIGASLEVRSESSTAFYVMLGVGVVSLLFGFFGASTKGVTE